jgi:hypothetical protein
VQPEGLYFVADNKAFFVPAKSHFYWQMELDPGEAKKKSPKLRLVEIKLRMDPIAGIVLPKPIRACDQTDRSCDLRSNVLQQMPYDKIIRGSDDAREAMNKFITKMLPGVVDRFMLEQKEAIVLSTGSESDRQSELAELSTRAEEGLLACQRALPKLEPAVAKEMARLASYQEATSVNNSKTAH